MNYYAQYILTGSDVALASSLDLTGYTHLHFRFTAVEDIYSIPLTAFTGVYKAPEPRFILTVDNGSVLGTYYFSFTAGYTNYQDVFIDISGLSSFTGLTLYLTQDRSDTYKVYFTVKDVMAKVMEPLQIAMLADGVETVIFTQPENITQLTYIPERNQDLRLIQGNVLQGQLTTKGQVKCVGVGIEYDEQEGSL